MSEKQSNPKQSVFVLSYVPSDNRAGNGKELKTPPRTSFVKPFLTHMEAVDYIAESKGKHYIRGMDDFAIKEIKLHTPFNVDDFNYVVAMSLVKNKPLSIPKHNFMPIVLASLLTPEPNDSILVEEVLGVYTTLEDAKKAIPLEIDLDTFLEFKVVALEPQNKIEEPEQVSDEALVPIQAKE